MLKIRISSPLWSDWSKKRENITDKVVMAVYGSIKGITTFKGTVSSILHKPQLEVHFYNIKLMLQM